MATTRVPDQRARDYALINARLERLPNWGLGVPAFVALGLCYLFAFYDIAVIGVALPAIAGSLHLSGNQVALPITTNLVGYIVGALLLGHVADRVGRRRMLVAVIIIIAVTAVLTAFSWNDLSLAIFRFGAGMGTGAMITLAATSIGEFSPARKRGRYVTYNAFWTTIGNVIPALLALGLIRVNGGSGWRVMLAIPVVTILLLFLFRDSVLPESPRWLAAHGHAERASRIVAAMERRTCVPPLGETAVAAALAAPGSAAETSTGVAVLLRRPFPGRVALVFAFWFFFYFTIYAMLAYEPTLIERLGVGVTDTELITAMGFCGDIAAALVLPLFIDKMERRHCIVAGLAVFVLGLAILALSNSQALIATGAFVAFFGSIIAMFTAYAYTAEIFPTRARASATAMGDGLGHLGGAVQPYVVVPLIAAAGARPVFWMMAGSLVLAMIVMRFAVRTTGRTLSDLSALPGQNPAGEQAEALTRQ